jgi:NAD(P)H dehydrogenase (quinone)
MRVLIVVASQTGRTARMGEAVAAGAKEAGGDVVLRRPEETSEADLLGADAVILGSGVHMAGIESSMRLLFERMAPLWMQGALVGKLGAAFVSAGAGARGGGELALMSLWAFLAENGMLLVPTHNRLDGYTAAGCHWGPVAWTHPRDGVAGPTEAHLRLARAHGRYVTECARRWRSGATALDGPP